MPAQAIIAVREVDESCRTGSAALHRLEQVNRSVSDSEKVSSATRTIGELGVRREFPIGLAWDRSTCRSAPRHLHRRVVGVIGSEQPGDDDDRYDSTRTDFGEQQLDQRAHDDTGRKRRARPVSALQ